MARMLFLLTIYLSPSLAWSGVCDLTWDGNKLAENSRGRPLTAEMQLTDNNKNAYADLTVAQIMAFHEAKEAISRQIDRSPSYVVCSDKKPNAFAMKGKDGDIVGVTVGMMKLVNGDRDMAATIIGHEYAHLIKNHGQAGQTADTIFSILGAIIGTVIEYKTQQRTNVQGLGINLGNIGASLASSKFSRDQEREADEVGFSYMVDAGFNPKGAVRLANRMNSAGLGTVGLFFDSHPGWEERDSRFQTMIANNPSAQQIIARSGDSTTLQASQKKNVPVLIASTPIYEASGPQKSFNDAVVAWRQQDFYAAEQGLRASAEASYAPAQALLGWMYSIGKGVPKDDAIGVEWYQKAAAQGNASAQSNLGAAYANGQGVAQDYTEALRWYRLAAAQGNDNAQNSLGNIYANGHGVPKDDVKAVEWYRLAALQGDADAQNNLGAMYHVGHGVPKNDVIAMEWLQKAAIQGHARAQYNLGMAYANGHGVPKDDAKAVEWYRLAAAQGDAFAQGTLGVAYTNGQGVPKDDAIAVEWFQKAAIQGYARAQYNLFVMYTNGQGVPIDDAKALEWCRLAAAQGHTGAQSNLASKYFHGHGVVRDLVLSYAWRSLAASQGDATSIKARDSLESSLTSAERAEGQGLASNWKKGEIIRR